MRLIGGLGDGGRTDAHEAAELGLVFDDADVVFDDGAARQALGEGGEIGDAADGLGLLEARERVGEGNDVDGRARVGELGHAQEDAAVGIEGEIVGLDRFGGFGVGGVIEQDGAEDGALGVEVGRQAGVEGKIGGLHDCLFWFSARSRSSMYFGRCLSNPRSR